MATTGDVLSGRGFWRVRTGKGSDNGVPSWSTFEWKSACPGVSRPIPHDQLVKSIGMTNAGPLSDELGQKWEIAKKKCGPRRPRGEAARREPKVFRKLDVPADAERAVGFVNPRKSDGSARKTDSLTRWRERPRRNGGERRLKVREVWSVGEGRSRRADRPSRFIEGRFGPLIQPTGCVGVEAMVSGWASFHFFQVVTVRGKSL